MRLWHYRLLPVLPRQQLISQWRECCCIAKLIAYNKTPNHLLVNKITDYPAWEFMHYCYLIQSEIRRRGYSITNASWITLDENLMLAEDQGYFAEDGKYDPDDLFQGWHNDRYLIQCYYNLEEKYDCGGITDDEWIKIDSFMRSINLFIL